MKLNDLYRRFKTPRECVVFIEAVYWENGPVCPYCNSGSFTEMADDRYHCNTCNTSYSITVGTMFHKTKCDLQKWFYVLTLYEDGIKMPPVRELAETIMVTKDTAAKILQRIKNEYLTNRERFNKLINHLKDE